MIVVGLIVAIVVIPAAVAGVVVWRGQGRVRISTLPVMSPPPPLVLATGGDMLDLCSREVSRYVLQADRFVPAQKAKLLVDGRQTYPEMLGAIEGAKHSVDFETYILRADETGVRFQTALAAAARRGVRVRLLYDHFGSLGLSGAFVEFLLNAGVEVGVYHPLVLTRPRWAVNRRDHRKILIVDQSITFTGGINISNDYADPSEGGAGWRDTHVRLDGAEVARRAEQLFRYGWRQATPYHATATAGARLKDRIRRRLKPPPPVRVTSSKMSLLPPEVCRDGRTAVQLVGNREFRLRRRIRRHYLHAIRNAQRYILIENAYFIPDGRFRRELARAVRRGVQVVVMVASHSDVPLCAYASRHLYRRLLLRGVRIFEWPGPMMHGKTAVIDDAWSVVGSYNIDHRSLFHQLECVAVIADPRFAARLRDQTLADLAQCHELTLAEHDSRPAYRRLLEPAAYMLRYWL